MVDRERIELSTIGLQDQFAPLEHGSPFRIYGCHNRT